MKFNDLFEQDTLAHRAKGAFLYTVIALLAVFALWLLAWVELPAGSFVREFLVVVGAGGFAGSFASLVFGFRFPGHPRKRK